MRILIDSIKFSENTEIPDRLSVEIRYEVFSTLLLGSSDFKKKLFDAIFSDYGVQHLEVKEVGE